MMVVGGSAPIVTDGDGDDRLPLQDELGTQ